MALPGSGAITFGMINTEMGRSASAALSLNETAIRKLAGILSGVISLSNFYGKARLQLVNEALGSTWSDAASGSGITVISPVFASTRCTNGKVQIWGSAYGDGSMVRFYTSSDGGGSWTERGNVSNDRDCVLNVPFDATINRIKGTWIGGAYVPRSLQVWVDWFYKDITL